jgi:elongation factor Ts
VLDGSVVVYLHRKSPDLPPQVGVLVSFSGGGDGTGESGARGVAMQIAAMRPRYLTRQEVPAEVVETERRLAEQAAREEGKPEGAITKITEGRVNAFFKDFVLLEQASVVEPKKPVSKVLQEAGLTVHSFVRFEVGQT